MPSNPSRHNNRTITIAHKQPINDGDDAPTKNKHQIPQKEYKKQKLTLIPPSPNASKSSFEEKLSEIEGGPFACWFSIGAARAVVRLASMMSDSSFILAGWLLAILCLLWYLSTLTQR